MRASEQFVSHRVYQVTRECQGNTIEDQRLRIDWKAYSTKIFLRPKRCTNCLAFGHSKRFCENVKICAACSKEHGKEDCQKPLNVITLQEPYTIKGKIAHLLGNWRVVGIDNGRTGIIVADSNLEFTVDVLQDCIVAITVFLDQVKLALISVYFSPAEDLEMHLFQLENVFKLYTYDFIVVGDFNSKNFNWGAREMDQRGVLTYYFIVQYNLKLLNIQDFTPTFFSSVGSGWTDLALCSSGMDISNVKYEVLDLDTLSDHRYILINLNDIKVNSYIRKKYSRNIKRIEIIVKKSRRDIFDIEDKVSCSSNALELNNCISEMERLLISNMNRYLLIKKTLQHKNYTVWWANELDSLRRKLRASRKSYQVKNIPDELRLLQIKEDNILFWIGKIRIMIQSNSTMTILRSALKLDEGHSGGVEDSVMRDSYEEDIGHEENSQDYREVYDSPFTYEEIYCVISRLRTRSAPGLDGIAGSVIEGKERTNKKSKEVDNKARCLPLWGPMFVAGI
ncbi:uncharacterized protein LOC118197429, partial [Stegodyphus dumicola]|uniref:uncharacterized protein LOC118197429 n=1 Tax=Stegodyphus dumicola TaxID=202533 RepID=UPI0015AF2DEB